MAREAPCLLIGILDLVSIKTLRLLHELPGITQTVILPLHKLKRLPKKTAQKPTVVDVSINILGPKILLDNVGDAMTNGNIHLQHPYFLPLDVEYISPHYLYLHNIKTDLRHLIGPETGGSENTRIAQGLEEIFADLAPSQSSDPSCTELLEATLVEGLIITPLKKSSDVLPGSIALKKHEAPLLGGIDADVMGLGKTLTMLSAIVCSMKAATEFTRCYDNSAMLPTATRATLIYIQEHLKPGLLRLCVFHGSNRARMAEDIVDNDVVLTTYNTLVSDQKSNKLLQQLSWFRVVLDEAHWIRNNTSQQFKASCSIQASRRWCLTGTPIQNSLEDLRSLLAFLCLHPFSESGFFQKHIVEPLSQESPEQFRNLRLLLNAICFRRTAELLSLPPQATEEVTIALSDREVDLYEDTVSKCKKEFEEIANMKSSKKKYCVLFATIMKLRRLCNHEKQSYSPEEIPCAYCYNDNADIGITPDTVEVCPECSQVLDYGPKTALGLVSPTPLANFGNGVAVSADSPLREQTGFSSKLNAVVDNIQRSPATSKNLVFTSWRLTLDILQRLLAQRGIPCLRIDGQTSFSDRQSILTRFCEDPTQNVLLLSIATGAVGLTLTVADRVHIVEPQWNPTVEEQAIGRALRIGQKRSVTIFKYITKSTVEQNITSRQKRKSHLARISLGGQSDYAEDRLEDLMFLLQRNAC
ncbi:SNF2 family N-terminal domain-containing protein [Xylaria telfairii]|nr:SNF2 family N-terminal domain-containing protein [Xylaria telfairii]